MTTPARKTKSGIGGTAATTALVIAALALGLIMTALVMPPAARADAASVAGGAQLYKEKCLGCHGADGSGSTPMGKALKVQDLRKPEIQAKKDAELAASITNGKGKMPAQKGNLSAAQVGQIVDYIRTLAKAK